MTNFWSLHGEMFLNRFKKMNILLIGYIAVVLIVGIINMIQNHTFNVMQEVSGSFAGFGFLVSFIAYIYLMRENERAYYSNKYRLVPVSDNKFYGANLLSSFFNFAYINIVVGVLTLTTFAISFQDQISLYMKIFGTVSDHEKQIAFLGLIALGIMFVAISIFVWTSWSSVDLVTDVLTNFLPSNGQKFFKLVLYVVVAFIGLSVFGQITNQVQSMIKPGMFGSSSIANNDFTGINAINLWSLYLIIATIVESFINVYLLKNWTETKN